MIVKPMKFEDISGRFAKDRARKATNWINRHSELFERVMTFQNVFTATIVILSVVYVVCRMVFG